MVDRRIGRLCVFCGSSDGTRPQYLEAAEAVGRALARRRIGLVYGGGRRGVMGALADAALLGGGEVIGIIPAPLATKEIAHHGVTELRVVDSMHQRKAMMADLADGFVALPGGFGTYEELFEVITWSQLGIHAKPCGLLNVAGYFDPLIELMDHAMTEGFVRTDHRTMVLLERDIDRLIDHMAAYESPVVEKWITRRQT